MNRAEPRRYGEISAGDPVPGRTFAIDRSSLVRYAGASLDFNPIHWSESAAAAAGLPDIISHGMLIMSLAGRLLTDWTRDPATVVDFSSRFSSMVLVPDQRSVECIISGAVVEKMDGNRVAVELDVGVLGAQPLTGTVATLLLRD